MKERDHIERQWCPEVRRPLKLVAQEAVLAAGQGKIVSAVEASLAPKRVVAAALASANITEDGKTGPTCIGRDCAHWRWAEALKRGNLVHEANTQATVAPNERPANVPATWEFVAYNGDEGDPASWVEPLTEALGNRHGFCGKSGKPEFLD